ncbi:MAG: hypothetical protein H6591_04615 [Flavobacteriales bacterium]|nr:hypothetical protein [Flavobacteriales bacterium]
MSEAYWAGRRGQAYSGGDFSEYQRGRRDEGLPPVAPDASCVFGGVMLLLAIPLFAAVIVALPTALVGALAIMFLWRYRKDEFRFGHLYVTCLWSSFLTVVTTLAAVFLALWAADNYQGRVISIGEIACGALAVQMLFMLLVALIPYRRFRSRGMRPFGYWGAVRLTVSVIVPLTWCFMAVAAYVSYQYMNDTMRATWQQVIAP